MTTILNNLMKAEINQKYDEMLEEAFNDPYMGPEKLQKVHLQIEQEREIALKEAEKQVAKENGMGEVKIVKETKEMEIDYVDVPFEDDPFEDIVEETPVLESQSSNEYVENIKNDVPVVEPVVEVVGEDTEQTVEQPVEEPVGTNPTGHVEEQVSEIVDVIMNSIDSDLQNNQDIDTNLDALESAACDVISVVSKVRALFDRVVKAKPEKAYQECYKAMKIISRRVDGVNITKEAFDKAKARFDELESMKEETTTFDKIKAIFSLCLHAVAKGLAEVGAFAVDVAGVTGIYFTRLVASFGRETKWAAIEINRAFKKRFLTK